ncbi:MAG: hypothetical protein KCHDKBKB_01409 [Elusimicrobia bacterium]|nr:hypothetical protein [Elusimicrobiota bacterium]
MTLGLTSSLWALSMTPSVQSFNVKPGESVGGEVSVTNTDGETLQIVPVTKNWFVLPANKAIKVEDWLKMHSNSFELKDGETKKIKFTVKAPKKAQGELVGMLSFRTKSDSRSTVEFMLSGAVYAVIIGTEKLSGDIRAMMVNPSTDSVQAGILVRNTGNVHLRPHGIMQIANDKDQLVANVELEHGQPTYPGNERPYMGVVKDLRMSPGKYWAQIELKDFDRGVMIEKRRQKFVLTEERKVKF